MSGLLNYLDCRHILKLVAIQLNYLKMADTFIKYGWIAKGFRSVRRQL